MECVWRLVFGSTTVASVVSTPLVPFLPRCEYDDSLDVAGTCDSEPGPENCSESRSSDAANSSTCNADLIG